MICSLYKFPESAKFGKVVPKSKIYDHATPTAKVKELFVKEVEKIIWSHKLSPATINLPASDGVQEIQVFTILLSTREISDKVLQTIDKAIPSPILFELKYDGKIRYAASYKRPNEADKSKWVVNSHFQSDWMSDSTEKSVLPVVLNMEALYHSFLKAIMPLPFRKDETLNGLVLRIDQLRIKKREAKMLESQIKKEKQFNRCVEMNQTLNKLKTAIEGLEK